MKTHNDFSKQRVIAPGGVPLSPADRTAARVTAPAGQYETFDPGRTPDQTQFDEAMVKAMQARCTKPPYPTKNYFGQKRGRMTISFWSHSRKKPGADRIHYWLAKCQCGEYELRSHVALRKVPLGEDKCCRCKRTEFVIKHADWVRNGSAVERIPTMPQ